MSGWDYIIAGGGSAGCTLAARLCEDPSVTVLLLEAGTEANSIFVKMPAGVGFVNGNPRFDWGYESVPQPGLGGRRISYPRGKGLGGSSLINSMIYIRGNAGDYDRWREKGLKGWSYPDVLPYFLRSEGAAGHEGSLYHGHGGPLKVSQAGNFNRLNQCFIDACQRLQVPLNEDFNGERQLGVGRLDAKASNGVRQSAAQAYLGQRPRNLTVMTGVRVHRVLLEGRRAAGLQTSRGPLTVGREVVLSLGAFETPKVLMLSGVGPGAHLSDHGIAVVHDLPGVGQSLYDHPDVPMKFELTAPAMSVARYQRVDRALWLGLQWLLARRGPAASVLWSTMMFHATGNRVLPELQVFFTPMLIKDGPSESGGFSISDIANIGKFVFGRGKAAAPGFQFDINLMRPKSSGSVSLSSAEPGARPIIDPAYFTDERDFVDLVAGVRFMRQVAEQSPLQEVARTELSPGTHLQSDEDLRQAIRDLSTTGHHPACTARMGADNDPGAVLDSRFRVRGLDGLRVVDASALPDMITGNINAPVIMLAERAADMILERPALEPFDPRQRQCRGH